MSLEIGRSVGDRSGFTKGFLLDGGGVVGILWFIFVDVDWVLFVDVG